MRYSNDNSYDQSRLEHAKADYFTKVAQLLNMEKSAATVLQSILL